MGGTGISPGFREIYSQQQSWSCPGTVTALYLCCPRACPNPAALVGFRLSLGQPSRI